MSITSVEMRSWFFSTMLHPLRMVVTARLADSTSTGLAGSSSPPSLGVVLHPHFDQIAAAADALQNVLDVVRERGDGLPHGRQPLGLHHRGVVRVSSTARAAWWAMAIISFRCSSVNLLASLLHRPCVRRERSVDVDHADHVVAALHRHADRFAHAHLHDALGRVPAVILAGVAGQHAFVVFDHVVENRLRLMAIRSSPRMPRRWRRDLHGAAAPVSHPSA